MRLAILTLLLVFTTALGAQELRFKHTKYTLDVSVTDLSISYQHFSFHFTTLNMDDDDDQQAERHKRKARRFFGIGCASTLVSIWYAWYGGSIVAFGGGTGRGYIIGTSTVMFLSSFALIAAGAVHERKYRTLSPRDKKDKWKRHLVEW